MAAPIFSAVTGNNSAKVSQRFSELTFKFVVNATVVAATALAAVAAATITVNRTSGAGTDQVILPINILDLLEISAHIQGAIVVTNDGTNSTVEATLNFSELIGGGSITPKQNEVYEFIVNGVPAGTAMTVEILELKGISNKRYAIDLAGVTTAPTTVGVDDSAMLAITAANLVSIEWHYADQSKVLWTPEVCHAAALNKKPVLYVKNGLVTAGHDRLFVLDVEAATSVVVTATTPMNVIKLMKVGI